MNTLYPKIDLNMFSILFRWALFLSLGIAAYAQNSLSLATQYLNQHSARYGLLPSEAASLRITDLYSSQHNGITHLYTVQTYEGIDIYNARMNFAISKEGKVVSAQGLTVGHVSERIKQAAPLLTADDALALAAAQVGTDVSPVLFWTETEAHHYQAAAPEFFRFPVSAHFVYYLAADKSILPAWDISFAPLRTAHWWSMRISAQDGSLLEQNNYTKYCDFGAEAHWNHPTRKAAHPEPEPLPMPATNDYLVYAFPVESPSYGERSVVNSPWLLAGAAGTLGWHNDGNLSYTITRGNNVYAQEDINGNDGFGYAPNSPGLEFVYPLDFNIPVSQQRDPAITNLFYVNNMMHDVWYQYGFDEPAGNFQRDNLGRGGQGNDYVIADALDGSGTSNANFTAPPDGANGRMQMYEWGAGASNLLEVLNPSSIAGDYQGIEAAFGPALPFAPSFIEGSVVLVNDGSSTPSLGCFSFQNAGEIAGHIALIDRGDCLFVEKITLAEEAGALAVIVINNVGGAPISMGAGAGTNTNLSIPSIMISQSDGDLIKSQLASGVTARLQGNSTSLTVDGDYDNGVVAHEYAHGISLRLTGGPSTTDCLVNAEQAGEGWSDYAALMMTLEPGDAGADSRPIGIYATSQPLNGIGIRNAPYSTDFSINDYTYGDSNNSNDIAEPHGIGFIFCTALWEMTWALIDVYGFDPDLYHGTGGNNLAMQLVTDGMKLQPCNPGMIDSRDAILLADRILNGEDSPNQCIIWEAFARRGFGYSASQGSSASRTDQVEAFDMPPLCLPTLKITKNASPAIVAPDGTLTYHLTITNDTPQQLNNLTITDALPPGLEFLPENTTCTIAENAGVLTITGLTLDTGESLTCSFQTRVTFSGSQQYYIDDMENGSADWLATHSTGTTNFVLDDNFAHSPTRAWYGRDMDSETDLYLRSASPLLVAGEATELRFWHFYDTEATWDGGVAELSLNGSTNWIDLGPYFTQNGYNSTIQENPASALSGRPAFTGNSADFIESVISLSAWAGQQVYIRFRFASDGFVGGNGWYIDDVSLLNAQNITNEVCVSDGGQNSACDEVTVLVSDNAAATCSAPPFSIIQPAGASGPLNILLGQDLGAFSTTLGPGNPDIYYLLASSAPTYEIIAANSTGNFNFSTLIEGQYTIWALYYSSQNIPPAADYLENTGSINDILSDLSSELCIGLSNTTGSGDSVQIQVLISGIEDQSSGAITLYPTPAGDELFIQLQDADEKKYTPVITDLLGRALPLSPVDMGNGLFRIPLAALPSGLYFCSLRTSPYNIVKPFIKR